MVPTALSVLIAAILIGFALIYTPDSNQDSKISITTSELSTRTGIDGNECWVAIDSKVYKISDSSKWVMGRHTPAKDDRVVCGHDLSEYIGKSPHGRSILHLLKVVGHLQH